jgi:PAS domain S-box-containing protein
LLKRSDDREAKQRPRARAWSIPTHLVAVALASTVPIAVVAGALAYHLLSVAAQNQRHDVEERLRLLRDAVEMRIANVIEDLQVLARSPALQDGHLEAFRRHAVEAASVVGAIGVVMVDRDGQQVLSTRTPWGAPLPRRRELDTQERAFTTGAAQVSDLVPATSDGQPIISVEVPVRISGTVRYVLAAELPPKYLSEIMAQYVPPDMIGSIIDRKGILIARQPVVEGTDLVGKPTIPEIFERIGQPSALWIETVSRSGVRNYSSFVRSDQTGWSINLALPRRMVDAPLRRAVWLFAAIAVLALVASLLFSRLVAARLLRALSDFEQHVIQLGFGLPIWPQQGPVTEINRMEDVLHSVGSEVAAAKASVERERSLLQATVESMPIGVLLITADGNVSLVNRKILSLWGVEELRSIEDLRKIARFRLDGTPYAAAEWPIVRALTDGNTTEDEEVVQVVAGVRRHMVVSAVPVHDGSGQIIAAVAACYDVTEMRDAMRRQQILLDEINHRVKNTLATVQSVARLTLSSSDTLQDYANGFERRLLALSAAYNVLTDNNWEGADLRAIVERTLAPYAGRARTATSGPAVTLKPKFALALAAAIQELSTNAAKYGSLSTQAGHLDVRWSVQEDERILLSWTEDGGPPVITPKRRGFGTRLIQDILANETGWTVTLDFLSTGLRCTMVIDRGYAAS